MELKRLERRLQRERESRRAAEAIAERGLRELYEGQQQLMLLKRLSTAANQSVSTRQAMRFTLKHVCEHAGWALGHVYVAHGAGEGLELRSHGVWYGDLARHQAFRHLSEESRFSPGVGLPGQVLETRLPVWLNDVAHEANFPRAAIAIGCGLSGAFAFPVLVGPDVVAVLEFFAESPREPDDALLRTMAHAGDQLGRVMERRRAERRLKAKNAELTRLVVEADRQRLAAEAASRAKSAFLAVTSHEIRTPLHAVLGLAEALKRESLTRRQRGLTDGVLDAGAMLLRLLNAVLDMSKIEAGRMTLAVAPFDLAHTAETVVQIWQAKADERGLRVELDLSGLPRPCVLLSDEGKIEQTLINLLSNAMKFSAPGGAIVVRLAATPGGGDCTVRAEIVDAGPGIPAEDRARVFEPFEQTPSGREQGGAGLGLAICAGNLALLGGSIGVDAAPGGGSCFWFEFSAGVQEDATTGAAAANAPATLGRPLRILAAEDNAANRMVLQVLLEPAGVELSFAENGEIAVAAVQTSHFDLVLMDVNMPVMNGVDALHAIRTQGGPGALTPVHMLTANVFDDDLALYRRAGADGVLKKPIELDRLYQLLAEASAVAAEGVAATLRAAG